jgi:hypothetical protein
MSILEEKMKSLLRESVTCRIEKVSDRTLESYQQEYVEVKAELKRLNKLYKHDLKNMKFSEVLERGIKKERKRQLENNICFMEMKEKQDRGEQVLGGFVRLV